MGLHPADRYKLAIDYLEEKLKKDPKDKVLESILHRFKNKEKESREKWRYKYSNINECTGSII